MAKDLSHLSGGNLFPPDRPSEFGKLLFEGWIRKLNEEAVKSKAFDTLMRASDAGLCTRRLWFTIDNPEQAFTATPADRWRMAEGTLIHKLIEEVMVPMVLERHEAVWIDVDTEPKFDLRPLGVSISGHGDLRIVDIGGIRIVIEIKTIGGTGFKERAFDWNGGPKGPQVNHARQVALAAKAFDADVVVLLYISMENMSPKMLAKAGKTFDIQMEDWDRFIAEWVFAADELEDITNDEMRRLRLVTKAHEAGLTASDIPRVVVVDGPKIGGRNVTITQPKKYDAPWEIRDTEGELLEVGDTYVCGYCPFFDECVEAGDPS